MQQRNTIRIAIITSVLLFLALIGYAIYTISVRAGKIQTSITVYPEDAIVSIDGKKSSSTSEYLMPGKHTFVAHKNGFLDDTETLYISETTKSVVLLPTPDSDSALQWANQQDVQAYRETLGGQQANIRGTDLTSRYPLMKDLPYIDINGPFALDYGYKGQGNSDIFFLIHESTPNGRKAAFEWIRQKGIDPATLDIRYDEYQNPLTSGAAQ